MYKTRLCLFWEAGHCVKGRFCDHAHGTHEVRIPTPPSPWENEVAPLPTTSVQVDANKNCEVELTANRPSQVEREEMKESKEESPTLNVPINKGARTLEKRLAMTILEEVLRVLQLDDTPEYQVKQLKKLTSSGINFLEEATTTSGINAV